MMKIFFNMLHEKAQLTNEDLLIAIQKSCHYFQKEYYCKVQKSMPEQIKSVLCPVDCFFAEGMTPPNEYPRYVIKQLDGEVPVMLELYRMRSTLSFPSLPGPLWLGVVAPDEALSMDQIELNCVLMLNWIVWHGTAFFTLKLHT